MKNIPLIIFGLAVAGISAAALAANNGVDITQVPKNAKPVNGNKEAGIKASNRNQREEDYQAEILNNPELNERARSKAIMENKFGGNSATIVQTGKSNKSSVTQSGSGNYANQTQTGNSNDLRLEQAGDNNISVEKQTGDNSHKVIIQNGNKREETIINGQPQEQDE